MAGLAVPLTSGCCCSWRPSREPSQSTLPPPTLPPAASAALEGVLSSPHAGWAYSKGFVSADMIREHLPAPGEDVLLLLCGPPPMVQLACHPNLDKLGYSPKMRFTY